MAIRFLSNRNLSENEVLNSTSEHDDGNDDDNDDGDDNRKGKFSITVDYNSVNDAVVLTRTSHIFEALKTRIF